MKKTTIAGLGLAGVLGLGLAVPALAQSGSTPRPQATTDTDRQRDKVREAWEEWHADRDREFAQRLAKELGISQDEVEKALEKVRGDLRDDFRAARLTALEARLKRAVEDGDLTRSQADAILEAARKGVLGGPWRLGGPGRLGPEGFGAEGFGPGMGRGLGHGFGHFRHHGPGGFDPVGSADGAPLT